MPPEVGGSQGNRRFGGFQEQQDGFEDDTLHRRETVLEPYWTRVELEEVAGSVSRLRLVQRRRRVELGCFLSDPEKRDLGEALEAALRRYRTPEFDNPQLR
jgi:hypothetical protein